MMLICAFIMPEQAGAGHAMRVTLVFVVLGAAATVGGCAVPPYAAFRPTYRREPVRPRSVAAVGPERPLPVPPQPPVGPTDAACARAAPADIPEARQHQLFKQFAQLEKSKQAGSTVAAAPSASGAPVAPPACGPPQ